jgi:hypothetical protein
MERGKIKYGEKLWGGKIDKCKREFTEDEIKGGDFFFSLHHVCIKNASQPANNSISNSILFS